MPDKFSPEAFDADWYAKVEAKNPGWAALLRQAQYEKMNNPGILARIARAVSGQYPMPPAQGILQGIVNGQPIVNPRPAILTPQMMTGVRS